MVLMGLDVLVLIIGLIMYMVSKDGKVQEMGRVMFSCGLLALLLTGGSSIGLITGPR